MIEIKTIYPAKDCFGRERDTLIEHYAEDEYGKKYYIVQNETGIEYESAVDVYPCRYTYSATNKPVEELEEPTMEVMPNENY